MLAPEVSVMLLVPLMINGILALVVNIPWAAPMLPTLALPETLAVPVILAPVPDIVNVVLPTAAIVTLPLAVPKNTLLLPFANVPMMLPKKRTLPPAINEYELVIVALVLATGPPAIYIVAALVNVTVVLVAAKLGAANACIAALAIVAAAAALPSVYVVNNERTPKLPVIVDTLLLPVATPDAVNALDVTAALAAVVMIPAAVIETTLAVPVTPKLTLALATIDTLLLPFCTIGTLAAVVAITVAVPILPTLALPTTLAVPAMLAPVAVTTN